MKYIVYGFSAIVPVLSVKPISETQCICKTPVNDTVLVEAKELQETPEEAKQARIDRQRLLLQSFEIGSHLWWEISRNIEQTKQATLWKP